MTPHRDTTVPSYRLGPALLCRLSGCLRLYPGSTQSLLRVRLRFCYQAAMTWPCFPCWVAVSLSRQRPFRRGLERHRRESPLPQQRCRSRHLLGVNCLTSLSTNSGRTQRYQFRNRNYAPPCITVEQRGVEPRHSPECWSGNRTRTAAEPSEDVEESNPHLLPTACPMVEPTGFEPATFCVPRRRTTGLCYGPMRIDGGVCRNRTDPT